MATIYHLYSEMEEIGIYRRFNTKTKKSQIYINEGSRPRTPSEYESDYYMEGDDVYYAMEADKEEAPYVTYEKIDELDNMYKYLSEPFATILKEPFKDDKGVMYANGGKTLVKAPDSFEGEYQCREGVEVIFRRAFENSDITKIIFPDTLKEIGFAAFASCKKLAVADFPTSLQKIDGYAFSDSALESAKIPLGVTSISGNLFSGCSSLKHVELHDNIVDFSGDAFEGTKKLFNIVLPKHIHSLGYLPFRYSGLTNITIPGSVKEINSGMAYESNNLCYVVIEDGVEKLGDFCDCKNLEYVVLPASIKEIEDDVFDGASPLIFVPKGMIEHYRKILPERLHEGLLEDEVPEQVIRDTEEKIKSLKEQALSPEEDILDLFNDEDDVL